MARVQVGLCQCEYAARQPNYAAARGPAARGEGGRGLRAADVRVGPTGRPAPGPRPGAGTGPGGDSAEGSGRRASESAPASMVERPHSLRGVRRKRYLNPGPQRVGRPGRPRSTLGRAGLLRCAAHPRHGEEPSITVGRGVPRRGPSRLAEAQESAPHAARLGRLRFRIVSRDANCTGGPQIGSATRFRTKNACCLQPAG